MLISNNTSLVKQKESDEIKADTKVFIEKGGQIRRLHTSERGEKEPKLCGKQGMGLARHF